MAIKIKIKDGGNYTKKQKKPIAWIVASAFLLIVTLVIGFLYYDTNNKYSSLKKQYKDLNSEYKTLEKQNKSLTQEAEEAHSSLFSIVGLNSITYVKNKLNFMDEKIVFQIEGYGNYYYTYDCMNSITSGYYNFWAFNKEAAIGRGLREGSC